MIPKSGHRFSERIMLSNTNDAGLPPERGRDLVGAWRAKIDLVLVARVGERGVDRVGHVAHPEGEARLVELRHAEIAARNVDESKQVGGGEGLHRGEVALEPDPAPDVAPRAADLDRPAPVV